MSNSSDAEAILTINNFTLVISNKQIIHALGNARRRMLNKGKKHKGRNSDAVFNWNVCLGVIVKDVKPMASCCKDGQETDMAHNRRKRPISKEMQLSECKIINSLSYTRLSCHIVYKFDLP